MMTTWVMARLVLPTLSFKKMEMDFQVLCLISTRTLITTAKPLGRVLLPETGNGDRYKSSSSVMIKQMDEFSFELKDSLTAMGAL
jgi:hypothetical protein